MSIIKRSVFPNTILAMANSEYLFGTPEMRNNFFSIVHTLEYSDVATIHITSLGTIGFDFKDGGELASIEKLEFQGDGQTPDEVMENEDAIHTLQEKRIEFVNFIVAALFGRISAKRHISLMGALYNGQDKITSFNVGGGIIRFQKHKEFMDAINSRMKTIQTGIHQSYILKKEELEEASTYVQSLWARKTQFQDADLVSCMVMNYQGAILHNQQHAAASLALNFSVIESLVKEIFYSYGLVGNQSVKAYATKPHHVKTLSRKSFCEMQFHMLPCILKDGGLINDHLYHRIDESRKKRNDLMHKGERINCKDSGSC